MTVLVETVLPRPRAFSWETHEYLQITEIGSREFIDRVLAEDWKEVQESWPDTNRMTAEFHRILDGHLYSCFRWRKVRRKSADKPWISDGVRFRIKRRTAVFNEEGRSDTWKRLDKATKAAIAFRKKIYEEKMSKKLEESGRTGQWYSIYKYLSSDEIPNRWNITELKPSQDPRLLANDLGEHFAKITNLSPPLSERDIPLTENYGLIPQLDVKKVENFIKKFKKCASRVNGDIPRDLVNPCASSLAKALTPIYNACLLTKTWPNYWKIETIVPIPKMLSPGSMDDLRPISMTTLWSKILESHVARFTLGR